MISNPLKKDFPHPNFDILPTKSSSEYPDSSSLNVTYIPAETKPIERHSVHWFRKGLRLHDNPSLCEGLKDAITFRCIFLLDPWFAGNSNVGINKWRFLLQCLEDLDSSLRKIDSRLYVLRGQPNDVFPKIFDEWGTTCFTFEEDPEPFGKMRDYQIIKLCKKRNIEVIQVVSHTLYKLEKIMEKNDNRAPLTYNQFQCLIETMGPPPHADISLPNELFDSVMTPISADHDERYGVPTLNQLGYETENLKPPVWIGGETEALARLERHLERKAWVASFGKPKMTPQSLLASQTGLSPYLRFGCLSVRLFYHQLSELYRKIKNAEPPLSLHGQLLWREFFFCAAAKNWHFDKMKSNPICIQIPWNKNSEALAKWANGQTGFPWIDAIMIQLREEGWIHHLARHAVICFLTRGDLWISWEEGAKVFEELLLDADWSVNAGMWMWLSSSSFFQQFFHCYCPVRFGRRADPNGDYIRRYLPILKKFPVKYIHEPWTAPEEVQIAAKCIVGRDYPVPMVDHAVVSRINTERLRQVYQQLYRQYDKGSGIKSKEMLIDSEIKRIVEQGHTNSPDSSGILSLKMNDMQVKPGTSNSNGQPYRFISPDQPHFSQNNSQPEFREVRNHKRFRTRVNNQQNKQQNDQQQPCIDQFPFPQKDYNLQPTIAQLKSCRYRATPVYTSYSDHSVHDSESENSVFDESASDSMLIAYNRITHRNMNSSSGYYPASSEWIQDNRVNCLQPFNEQTPNQSNAQPQPQAHSYGTCSNEYNNNPNNISQIGLMPVYQSQISNENFAPQQQSYLTDYQNYEHK